MDVGDVPQWKVKQKEEIPVTYEEQNTQELLQAEQDAESYNTAIKEKRLDLCNPIVNQQRKDECRDMIGAAEALQEKNPELCSILSSETIRERCTDNISFFLATEAGDPSLCKTIVDETILAQCKKTIDEGKLESHIAS